LYVNTGLVLGDALENLGDRAGAAAVMQRTEQVARATRIDEFFSFINQRGGVPLPITGDTAPRLPVPSSLPRGKRDTGGNYRNFPIHLPSPAQWRWCDQAGCGM
jgi:hypothetical protein